MPAVAACMLLEDAECPIPSWAHAATRSCISLGIPPSSPWCECRYIEVDYNKVLLQAGDLWGQRCFSNPPPESCAPDRTGVESVELICNDGTRATPVDKPPHGTWMGDTSCPTGQYITGEAGVRPEKRPAVALGVWHLHCQRRLHFANGAGAGMLYPCSAGVLIKPHALAVVVMQRIPTLWCGVHARTSSLMYRQHFLEMCACAACSWPCCRGPY